MESQSSASMSGRGVHWGSGIGPRYWRQSLPPGRSFSRFWLHEIALKRGKSYEVYWNSRNIENIMCSEHFWTSTAKKIWWLIDMLFVSPFGAEAVWVVFVASPIEGQVGNGQHCRTQRSLWSTTPKGRETAWRAEICGVGTIRKGTVQLMRPDVFEKIKGCELWTCMN